uniref:Methyltransferase FkbM domain-containing protein n=1 Tax=viral metagenome TaxID=1070528 RepID=A0A6C0HAF4_9ZZZZ
MFSLNNFRKKQTNNLKNINIKNEKIKEHNEKIKEHNKRIKKYNEYKNKYSPLLFNKLSQIQNSLKLEFGTFMDEYPEQMMAIRYLTGNEKVLEIGGNIGRNSLVIASILNNHNNNNFVTLESDPEVARQLLQNKNTNNLNFFVENSALSKRNLIQKSWETIVSDVLLDGYKKVNIINFEQLEEKYNINFDTLILDCEGAFYYILQDMPEILNNIKLIIMENDYLDESHKKYIDHVLREKGFIIDYIEGDGWGHFANNFYEVWKK